MKPFSILASLLLLSLWIFVDGTVAQTTVDPFQAKPLILQYDKPAPDSDLGWVNDSLPLGNGYMGVNVFGGIDTERFQITENSLYDSGKDRGLNRRGLNNFAEVYLDFDHGSVSQYKRALDLNAGLSFVEYTKGDIQYRREYFTSYPDKVMVVQLSASQEAALSFTLRLSLIHI